MPVARRIRSKLDTWPTETAKIGTTTQEGMPVITLGSGNYIQDVKSGIINYCQRIDMSEIAKILATGRFEEKVESTTINCVPQQTRMEYMKTPLQTKSGKQHRTTEIT